MQFVARTEQHLTSLHRSVTAIEARLSAIEANIRLPPPYITPSENTPIALASSSSSCSTSSSLLETPNKVAASQQSRNDTSTGISSLMVGLPDSVAEEIRNASSKCKTVRLFTRTVCEKLFTKDELAVSNVKGKAGKEQLDENRTSLIVGKKSQFCLKGVHRETESFMCLGRAKEGCTVPKTQ